MEEGRALEQTPRLAVGKRVEQNTWQVSGSEDASKKTRHLKVQYLSVSFFFLEQKMLNRDTLPQKASLSMRLMGQREQQM